MHPDYLKWLKRRIADRMQKLVEHVGGQERFCHLIKIEPRTVDTWLYSESLPSVHTLIDIACNTNVLTDWLLFGVGHDPETQKRIEEKSPHFVATIEMKLGLDISPEIKFALSAFERAAKELDRVIKAQGEAK